MPALPPFTLHTFYSSLRYPAKTPASVSPDLSLYTIKVHIEEKLTHDILQKGKYQLRVAEPEPKDKDEPAFRDKAVIIRTEEPYVTQDRTVEVTFSLEPPEREYFIGYKGTNQPCLTTADSIMQPLPIMFGQVYTVDSSGHASVKSPAIQWVGSYSFGFRNFIPATPVILIKDKSTGGLRVISNEQKVWDPGVGCLTPRVYEPHEHEVAIWFQNQSETSILVKTVGQSNVGIVTLPVEEDFEDPSLRIDAARLANLGIHLPSLANLKLVKTEINVYYWGGKFHKHRQAAKPGGASGTSKVGDPDVEESDSGTSDYEDEVEAVAATSKTHPRMANRDDLVKRKLGARAAANGDLPNGSLTPRTTRVLTNFKTRTRLAYDDEKTGS